VTIIRLNLGGILKLTDIPIASMVNRIFPASVVSSYLSETTRQENSLAWIEIMMKKEINQESFRITREIIDYIDTHYTDLPANISKLIAKKFGISESTLQRYFKKYIGLNVSTYMLTLKRKKMIKSVYWNQYDSVTAQENGYYDQSHFINDFKRLFGLSLQEYFREIKTMKERSSDIVRLFDNH